MNKLEKENFTIKELKENFITIRSQLILFTRVHYSYLMNADI